MIVPEAFKLLKAGCKTHFIEGDAISELHERFRSKNHSFGKTRQMSRNSRSVGFELENALMASFKNCFYGRSGSFQTI